MPTQLASDNFQRADANPISGNWTNVDNAIQIVSHLAEATVISAYNIGYYNDVVWPNDQYSEITIGATDASFDYVMPAVRVDNSVATAYFALAELNTGNIFIQELTNGTVNTLAGPTSSGAAFQIGDVIRLTVQGTTLTATKNGATILSVSDSSILSGNAGIGFFTATLASAAISLWAGGNLQTPTVSNSTPGRAINALSSPLFQLNKL